MATSTLANPSDLAGAEACRVMLSSLNGLPRAKVRPDPGVSNGHDDGMRYDYAGADLAIAVALNEFSDNAGFRRSLAHYFLPIMMDGLVPSVPEMEADAMLTDDGYRPEGGAISTPPNSGGTAVERQKLATESAYEIESIARVLQGLDESDEKFYLMRGLFLRLEALSGVIMSAVGDGDKGREVADMRAVLFGHQATQQREVAHV